MYDLSRGVLDSKALDRQRQPVQLLLGDASGGKGRREAGLGDESFSGHTEDRFTQWRDH